MMSAILLAAILALPHDDSAKPAYPNAKLLIEPAELARIIESEKGPRAKILDCRPESAFGISRIPQAEHVPVDTWSGRLSASDSRVGWEDYLFEAGFRGDERERLIVVYDENRSKDAARIWFILRCLGFTDVRILNGGWKAWRAE